jgi:hypothetical protein
MMVRQDKAKKKEKEGTFLFANAKCGSKPPYCILSF